MADPNTHMQLFVGELAGQVALLKAQIDRLAAENQRLVGEVTILRQQLADLTATRPDNVRPFTPEPV
jgi:regulator of replication initiation timing